MLDNNSTIEYTPNSLGTEGTSSQPSSESPTLTFRISPTSASTEGKAYQKTQLPNLSNEDIPTSSVMGDNPNWLSSGNPFWSSEAATSQSSQGASATLESTISQSGIWSLQSSFGLNSLDSSGIPQETVQSGMTHSQTRPSGIGSYSAEVLSFWGVQTGSHSLLTHDGMSLPDSTSKSSELYTQPGNSAGGSKTSEELTSSHPDRIRPSSATASHFNATATTKKNGSSRSSIGSFSSKQSDTTVSSDLSFTILESYEATPTDRYSTSTHSSPYSLNIKTIPEDKTYIVYTQTYEFTAAESTLVTGLPTTVVLLTAEYPSYSTPTAVITTDFAYYNFLANGVRGDGKSSHKAQNRRAVIGGVVGSAAALLLCLLILYTLRVRKKRRRNTKDEKGFTHELGRRLDYPELSDPYTPNRNIPVYASTACPSERTFLNAVPVAATLPVKSKLKVKSLKTWPSSVFRNSKSEGPSSPSKQRIAADSEDLSNPFRDEFDFQYRSRQSSAPTRPPVAEPGCLQAHESSTNVNRYSYISTLDESTSEQNSSEIYCSDSESIPIHLAPMDRRELQDTGRVVHSSSQSYLKEVI